MKNVITCKMYAYRIITKPVFCSWCISGRVRGRQTTSEPINQASLLSPIQYHSECGFRFGTIYFVFNSSYSVLLQHPRSHNITNFPHLGNKPLSKMPGDKNELKIFLTYCKNTGLTHGWFVILHVPLNHPQ
jgi:hypothetical protein